MACPKQIQLPNGCYAYEDTPGTALILYQQVLHYFEQGLQVLAGMTVFDVGANIGLFALESLDRSQGDAQIFCFEPAPVAFDLMQRALTEQFPASRIISLNLGVSSGVGEAVFYYRPAASAMSSFDSGYVWQDEDVNQLAATAARLELPKAYRRHFPVWFTWLPAPMRQWLVRRQMRRVVAYVKPIHCQLTTLAHVIDEHRVPRIDVLKIDVEGAEWEVLVGVAEHWPKIHSVAVEVHDVNGRLSKVQELLKRQGLKQISVHQEQEFRGTTIFSVWATRG